MAGIYLHIPFCKQACNYCDFHFSTSLKMKASFVDALLTEIELRKSVFDQQTINSIYFGGGTPSLLSEEDLTRIFETLFTSFRVSPLAEITLEANPDDLSPEKIKVLKNTPINRLSIGVQSFRDEDLRFMKRAHNAKEALSSIKSCKQAGFTNLTIDLIYGTPGMDTSAWLENLNIAFDLDIPHISSYALTVEPNTELHHQILHQKVSNVDENQSAAQFELLTSQMKRNGYEQYEISNFCKPGAYSKHNSSYWKKDMYLGLGPSAHSFYDNKRLWNVSNNTKYVKSLAQNLLPLQEEVLSLEDRYNEYVMTSLRTKWGCSIAEIETNFSSELAAYFRNEIELYVSTQNVLVKNEVYYLSEKGKLLADKIASDLFKVT
jgi:oxygen-independent coproporphyrinogen III oxidase